MQNDVEFGACKFKIMLFAAAWLAFGIGRLNLRFFIDRLKFHFTTRAAKFDAAFVWGR